MDLFGYSKRRAQQLDDSMRQIEVLARSLNAAYSLSHSEFLEVCRIFFLMMADSFFHLGAVDEEEVSGAEERIFGGSYTKLAESGYGIHVLVRAKGKLISAQGEFGSGAAVDFGHDGIPKAVKFIEMEDVAEAWQQATHQR